MAKMNSGVDIETMVRAPAISNVLNRKLPHLFGMVLSMEFISPENLLMMDPVEVESKNFILPQMTLQRRPEWMTLLA